MPWVKFLKFKNWFYINFIFNSRNNLFSLVLSRTKRLTEKWTEPDYPKHYPDYENPNEWLKMKEVGPTPTLLGWPLKGVLSPWFFSFLTTQTHTKLSSIKTQRRSKVKTEFHMRLSSFLDVISMKMRFPEMKTDSCKIKWCIYDIQRIFV